MHLPPNLTKLEHTKYCADNLARWCYQHLIPEITRANLHFSCMHSPTEFKNKKKKSPALSFSESKSSAGACLCLWTTSVKKKTCCSLRREKTEKKVKVVAAWALCSRTSWRFYINVWRVCEELEHSERWRSHRKRRKLRGTECVFSVLQGESITCETDMVRSQRQVKTLTFILVSNQDHI